MEGSSNELRVNYSYVTNVDFPVTLVGKTHILKTLQTSLGDFLAPATQVSMLLTGSDEAAAFDHFRTVSKRCVLLQHNGERLQDHVTVRNNLNFRTYLNTLDLQ